MHGLMWFMWQAGGVGALIAFSMTGDVAHGLATMMFWTLAELQMIRITLEEQKECKKN